MQDDKLIQELIEAAEPKGEERTSENVHQWQSLSVLKKQEVFKKVIEVYRVEGCTDEEIKWWWSLSNKERREIINKDQSMRFSYLNYFNKELGMAPEEAFRRVNKTFVICAEFPLNQDYLNDCKKLGMSPDDYAFPWALSHRLANYVRKALEQDEENFLSQVGKYSSMNAFLRQKIRAGKL